MGGGRWRIGRPHSSSSGGPEGIGPEGGIGMEFGCDFEAGASFSCVEGCSAMAVPVAP